MGLKVGDKIKIYESGKTKYEVTATVVKKIGRYYWLKYREFFAEDDEPEITNKFYKKGISLDKTFGRNGHAMRFDWVCRMHPANKNYTSDRYYAFREDDKYLDSFDKWRIREDDEEKKRERLNE